MLHTKFHVNRDNGSGEEGFHKDLTIFGLDGHLGHVIRLICIHFHYLALIKLVSNGQLVSEKNKF